MIQTALKEWAAICTALARGRQAVLLRKGGIAEAAGEFELKHNRFWLLPTYVHQQAAEIKAEAIPLLDDARADQPPPGRLRLSHFAEVADIYHLHDLAAAHRLAELHLWSEETVQRRFLYRSPGLHALVVRVFRAAGEHDLADVAAYAGCRSWVELDQPLPTAGAVPVLGQDEFLLLRRQIDRLLQPTALA